MDRVHKDLARIKMESRGDYFLVGLFTLALVAGLIFFGAWVMGATAPNYNQKLVIFFPDDVNGISPGSAVKYRGVVVGKVDKIEMDPMEPSYIRVVTEIDSTTPLRENTTVKLMAQGITGLNFIELETQDLSSPPLTPPAGKKYLVLHAGESPLNKLLKEAPLLLERYREVADRLLQLLSKKNIDAVQHTLSNAEMFTNNIVQHQKEINQIFDDTKKVLEEFKTKSQTSFSELDYFLRDSRKAAIEFGNLGKSLKENPSQIIYKPSYNGYKVEE